MDTKNPPGQTGHAQAAYLLRREALRQAAASAGGGSPAALDATLARISAEVTADAVERLNRPKTPK